MPPSTVPECLPLRYLNASLYGTLCALPVCSASTVPCMLNASLYSALNAFLYGTLNAPLYGT
jgi:hypothetical protein